MLDRTSESINNFSIGGLKQINYKTKL